jgi:uncharacterized protein YbaP (TraB family)
MRRAALAVLLALFLGTQARALPLWEIRGPTARVWLLGSVHFLRAGDHPLPEDLDRTLALAGVVYLELDLDAADSDAAGMLRSLATDPGGRDLRQLLGRSGWRRATRAAGALGIDLGTLLPYEPWYAALAITQLRLAQLGFDGRHGVETQVVAGAAAAGKEVRGLETVAEQLASLDGLPLAVQRRFLAATLADAAGMGDGIDALVAAWRRGDDAYLARELLAGVAAEPEVYRRVIVERNHRFLEAIRELARGRGDSLVVVGVLHLVGEDGIIAALAAEGYAPRPVR